MAPRAIVPVGSTFGRLTTITPAYLQRRSDGRNKSWVAVRCECGELSTAPVDSLKNGNTSSCGCFHRERAALANTTHGQKCGGQRSRLMSIWAGMRERCLNPNARNYRWYGAKGVTIYWGVFENFMVWAQENGYADGLEIDRINSDGPYSPDNCRWVTKKANLRNRDRIWNDELDARLVAYAQEHGRNPYDIITEAVTRYLESGKEVT